MATKEELKDMWGSSFPFPENSTQHLDRFKDVLAAARAKLGLPEDYHRRDGYFDTVAAILLDNQMRWFEHTVRPDSPSQHVREFVEATCDAIATVVYQSASIDLFSWQPATQPVGAVAYMRRRPETSVVDAISSIPEINLEIRLDNFDLDRVSDTDAEWISLEQVAVAQSQPVDMNAMHDLIAVHGPQAARDLIFCAVEELVARLEREAIYQIVDFAEHFTDTLPVLDLNDDQIGLPGLIQLASEIHRVTMRSPGNALVVGPEVLVKLCEWKSWEPRKANSIPVTSPHRLHLAGFIDRRFKVYMDPMLMGKRGFMTYSGPSLLDCGLVIAPYVFVFDQGKARLRRAVSVVDRDRFKVFSC